MDYSRRSELAVIQFGPVVKVGSGYHQSSQYAEFYGNLAKAFKRVTVTAGYLLPEDLGAPLSNEVSLSGSGVHVRAFRGNTARTPLLTFIGNYLRAFPVVVRSIIDAQRVFVFGPCLIGALAMWACKVTRRPFGFYWANDWEKESKYRSGPRRWRGLTNALSARLVQTLTRRAAMDASFVITPNYELYGELLEQSLSAHMPVPLVKIREILREPREACAAVDGRITLLYVGELRQAKGLDVLVDAFFRIKAGGDAVGRVLTLKFVGEGEMKQQLVERVRASDMCGDVTFCGHITDGAMLAREYLGASIFVLPSRSEGFPRVLYEAMATGLPIIATRVGGIPYLLKDGVDAMLTSPGDADAIVRAVHALVGDPGLYQRISKNAIRIFQRRVLDRIRDEGSLATQLSGLFGTHRA